MHVLYIINDSLRSHDSSHMNAYIKKYLKLLHNSFLNDRDPIKIVNIEFDLKMPVVLKGRIDIVNKIFEIDNELSLFYAESLARKKIYLNFPKRTMIFAPSTTSYFIETQGLSDVYLKYVLNRRQEADNIINTGFAFFQDQKFHTITQIIDKMWDYREFWISNATSFTQMINYAMAYIAITNAKHICSDKLPNELLSNISEYGGEDFVNIQDDIEKVYVQYNTIENCLQFFRLASYGNALRTTIMDLTPLKTDAKRMSDLDSANNIFSQYNRSMRFLHDIYHAIDFSIENQKEDKDD